MFDKKLFLSFVVCTHNGERTLKTCIDCLLGQRVEADSKFEIIAVTNGCTDGSSGICAHYASLYSDILMHIDLPVPGKSRALEAGFDAASGKYIAVVDDDNYLPADWAELVHQKVWSGSDFDILGTAAFLPEATEAALPTHIRPFKHMVAVGDQGAITGAHKTPLAWGAGCVFKREIWVKLRKSNFQFILQGRSGGTLIAGEDGELCLAANLLGYSVSYDNDIRLTHDIKASRFAEHYLCKLSYADGIVAFIMALYGKATLRRNINFAIVVWDTLLFSFRAFVNLLRYKLLAIVGHETLQYEIKKCNNRGRLAGVVRFSPQLPKILHQIKKILHSAHSTGCVKAF
jgi:glycosyltransferase involved in cell wall biosynthesis